MGDYQHLFASLPEVPLPAGLRVRIQERLRQAELARARLQAALYGSGMLASFAALLYAGRGLIDGIVRSGFYDYASLLLSGDAAVYGMWKDLAYSLAESLPIMGALALLVALAAFVWSSAHAYQSARRFSFA